MNFQIYFLKNNLEKIWDRIFYSKNKLQLLLTLFQRGKSWNIQKLKLPRPLHTRHPKMLQTSSKMFSNNIIAFGSCFSLAVHGYQSWRLQTRTWQLIRYSCKGIWKNWHTKGARERREKNDAFLSSFLALNPSHYSQREYREATNLVPRVLSYIGRVGENPGNEVEKRLGASLRYL